MYEQLSFLKELEIKQDKEQQKPKTIYATPCGGCKCGLCSNNVDCLKVKTEEIMFACFNCDECYYYNGKGKRNKKYECSDYKVTNNHAKGVRSRFKIVR